MLFRPIEGLKSTALYPTVKTVGFTAIFYKYRIQLPGSKPGSATHPQGKIPSCKYFYVNPNSKPNSADAPSPVGGELAIIRSSNLTREGKPTNTRAGDTAIIRTSKQADTGGSNQAQAAGARRRTTSFCTAEHVLMLETYHVT